MQFQASIFCDTSIVPQIYYLDSGNKGSIWATSVASGNVAVENTYCITFGSAKLFFFSVQMSSKDITFLSEPA